MYTYWARVNWSSERTINPGEGLLTNFEYTLLCVRVLDTFYQAFTDLLPFLKYCTVCGDTHTQNHQHLASTCKT